MASTSEVSGSRDSAVEQFCSITGAAEETARNTLEACNWNVELAINMHVDANDDNAIEDITPQVTSAVQSRQEPVERATQGDDDVRPPIPPVRQILVDDYPSVSYSNHNRRAANTVFDRFRDFEAEARWHQQMSESPDESSMAQSSKRRTLEDLFRPPLDLMCRGTFEMAREEGQKNDKWLMINIQNQKEFSCQVLNRDVWSHPTIKSIVSEHFIFWQNYHDSSEGQRFMQFYTVTDYPYVAILDPRTGERMRCWNAIDHVTFSDLITEFLLEHPSPSGSGSIENSSIFAKTAQDQPSIYDESEEEQLKKAIEDSLREQRLKESQKQLNIEDDDDIDSDIETLESDEMNDDVNSCDLKPSKEAKENNFESANDSEKKIEPVDDWREYLGPENGKKIEFVVRFPDGNKENITFPADSKLKALFLYLSSRGYSMNEYDVVTNFPRRNLKQIADSDNLTIESAGLHPRETLYVQLKT